MKNKILYSAVAAFLLSSANEVKAFKIECSGAFHMSVYAAGNVVSPTIVRSPQEVKLVAVPQSVKDRTGAINIALPVAAVKPKVAGYQYISVYKKPVAATPSPIVAAAAKPGIRRVAGIPRVPVKRFSLYEHASTHMLAAQVPVSAQNFSLIRFSDCNSLFSSLKKHEVNVAESRSSKEARAMCRVSRSTYAIRFLRVEHAWPEVVDERTIITPKSKNLLSSVYSYSSRHGAAARVNCNGLIAAMARAHKASIAYSYDTRSRSITTTVAMNKRRIAMNYNSRTNLLSTGANQLFTDKAATKAIKTPALTSTDDKNIAATKNVRADKVRSKATIQHTDIQQAALDLRNISCNELAALPETPSSLAVIIIDGGTGPPLCRGIWDPATPFFSAPGYSNQFSPRL